MLSRTQLLRDKLGLNRHTIDTPVTQHQQTNNKADLGVRPGPPSRAPAGVQTARPPRQPIVLSASAAGPAPSPGASPVTMPTPSPARSETALVAMPLDSAAGAAAAPPHPLLDAMAQGQAALPAMVEHHFAHVGQAMFSKAALRNSLQALMPAMAAAAPAGLPGMPAVLLTQTLALTTGADASRAVAALAALRELDPVAALTTAWQARAGVGNEDGTPPDVADAWCVAMALGATPSGMRVLQTVFHRPVPADQERNFSLLLKAAAEISAREPGLNAPTTMLQRPATPASLLQKALACAAARLAGDAQAAAPHAWALNAVRNDLFDTGPGTAYAAAEARLGKMGQWIDRAAGDRKLTLRNPMVGKSAFRALRHGAQQVDRGPAIARHRQAFDAALRRAAALLRDHLVQLAPFAKAGGPAQVPTALLRAAVLAHAVSAPAGTPLDGKELNDAALDDIATQLAALMGAFDGASDARLPSQLRQLPQLQALSQTALSLELLDNWLGDAEAAHRALPNDASTLAGQPAPQWAATVRAELRTATLEANGHDTRLPQVSREGVRGALKHIIANIEGSSRLRLTSGGVVGVGLRQISAAVSLLASGFLVRGKLDARGQLGRQAVFEIAMPPYDMEIMVATQKQRANQFGLGAFLGVDLGVAKVGGNTDITVYGDESSSLKGVTLRLPRIGRPVNELRHEFARLVDTLLDGTTRRDPRAAAREPLLKQLLQDFPELTVNQVGHAGDQRKRHGATMEGQASVQMPGLRASATAGGAIEAQRGVVRHYEDAAGSMRVERHIAGWNVRAGLGGRLNIGPSVDVGRVNLTSGNTDTTVIGAGADLLVAGSSMRREVVYQDGRLNPISFLETEHQNLGGFLDQVAASRENWLQARLSAPGTSRTAEGEQARLQQFLDEVAGQARATHSYAFRSTIRPDAAARVDAFRSSAALAERAAVDHTAAAMAEAAEAEWSRPESMQPYSLRAYERVTTQGTVGLNLIAQLGAFHAADATHINNRLDAA